MVCELDEFESGSIIFDDWKCGTIMLCHIDFVSTLELVDRLVRITDTADGYLVDFGDSLKELVLSFINILCFINEDDLAVTE